VFAEAFVYSQAQPRYLPFAARGARRLLFCLAAFFFAVRRMPMSSSMRSSTGLRFFALRRIQTSASRRLSSACPVNFSFLLMPGHPVESWLRIAIVAVLFPNYNDHQKRAG
jgi:hypothetical protein